jgi:hypothetical protein
MGRFFLVLLLFVIGMAYFSANGGGPWALVASMLALKLLIVCIPVMIVIWIIKCIVRSCVRTAKNEWRD